MYMFYHGDMIPKVKPTYNLSPGVVATVKRLVEEERVAPTQDALVEKAIAELDRLVRDAADARLWEQAARDPEFQDEVNRIDVELPADNLSRWDRWMRPARCGGRSLSPISIPTIRTRARNRTVWPPET